ncbi:3-oxoacyl-[acyl-carrier-protein] reductase FabG [Variovorax sp. SRS16]|uniref:SDR family NAD(P)-dependent oxidoreductase n=1 Tax=Variovorax sp. SRS16 TaxID=282217 RepID=UPI0013164F11|nr:SDR family oxidoreductase [Variovorax sp. SRS16]VTU29754.1 3-oxoacyl-[acyl-carrier-protein] reductase FabG [Variovorax sp. SRS16]
MDLGLKHKVVLVTGASEGIGKATALAFAREGARVAINARRAPVLQATADEIASSTGAEVLALPGDMTELESLPALVEAVIARWGRIDVLVNNAGTGMSKGFLAVTVKDLEENFRLNFFSTYVVSQQVVPHMVRQGGGVILNLGGITAKQAPKGPSTVSGPAKAAMFNFTKALAQEFGRDNIRVNYLMPGLTMTPRFDRKLRDLTGGDADKYAQEMQRWSRDVLLPGRRWGKPEEMADVIAFLCSDRASYMTGASVIVDGGVVRAL